MDRLGAIIVAVTLLALGDEAAGQACGRDCLSERLDSYLDAVVANDPSRAPLFVGFRQTENAVVVRPGTGTWQSVTGLGEVQRRYFDPETGQAVYFGSVLEAAGPAIVTLRVKVVGREITEAEWYIGIAPRT